MKGLKEIASRNNWDLKLISDVVFFQEGPGVRKHQYTSRGVKLLNVTNILDGYLDLEATDRYISEEEAYGKYKHFLVDEGDLLIACSGIKISYFDKKITFVSSEDLPLCMNTSTMRFKTNNENKLNIKYFYYFLKSNYFKKQLARQITGSAQLNFGPSHIKKMFIMIPEIEYQKILAKILDKITKLIEIRRKQIQAYDNLIVSLFFDMLQSELTSDKIEYTKLGDLTSHISSGSTPRGGSSVYKSEGIPLIRSQDVKMNNLDYSNVVYIDTETHDKMKRSKLKNRDVLLNITGASIGRTAVFYGEDDSANTNQHVAAIRLKDEKVSPEFLSFYFSTEYFQAIIKNISSGGTREALNYKQIREFDIPLISKIKQEKFIKNKEKIEEEKKKLNSSLKELENLFDALMQDAFSGNLFKD